MSALVEIRNVSKVYERGKQKVEVLHHVDLDIAKGDFFALMGPSGSGKTTLLNLIGGLDSPTDGSITVGGERIDKLGEGALAKWRSSHVGFIFQFYNLLPMLSAQKNVELPLLLTKLSATERKRNAGIALQLVGLADRASHKPTELSGGQQQRVAIARAIATRCCWPPESSVGLCEARSASPTSCNAMPALRLRSAAESLVSSSGSSTFFCADNIGNRL
jgi:putative ABC transport system ATP-binding protein